MTIEKETLYDYGLDIKSFLDENIDKSSKLKTTIYPNDSHLYYTVAISNQGINGVIRAGFKLERQDLIYKINDYSFNCGRIVVKN